MKGDDLQAAAVEVTPDKAERLKRLAAVAAVTVAAVGVRRHWPYGVVAATAGPAVTAVTVPAATAARRAAAR